MNGILGHNSLLYCYIRLGINWATKMNFGRNHAPGAGLITQLTKFIIWLLRGNCVILWYSVCSCHIVFNSIRQYLLQSIHFLKTPLLICVDQIPYKMKTAQDKETWWKKARQPWSLWDGGRIVLTSLSRKQTTKEQGKKSVGFGKFLPLGGENI